MPLFLLVVSLVALSAAPATDTLWERNLSDGGEYAVAELADLDGDGSVEVLVQLGYRDEPSRVVALDGATGERLWDAVLPGRSQAVAADLDGAGAEEVVVACGDSLLAIAGATGARIAVRALPGPFGELTSGRLGGAGTDIVCTAGEKRAQVLSVYRGADLTEQWSIESAPGDGPFNRGFTWPVVLDADRDGVGELVVAENGALLRCMAARGDTLWSASLGVCERLNPEGVVSSAAVAADLVPGGPMEIAVGCFAGALVVLDAQNGEEIARAHFGRASHDEHLANQLLPGFIRRALQATGEPVNCLTAVESEGGRGEELVLGCSDGFLYAWRPGSEEPDWRVDTEGDVYDPCVLIRADDNETPHLIAWDTGGAYLVDAQGGESVPLFPDGGGASRVLAGDLDGDGGLELVRVAPPGGTVTAYSLKLGLPRSAFGRAG
jgi:hypothetical protein